MASKRCNQANSSWRYDAITKNCICATRGHAWVPEANACKPVVDRFFGPAQQCTNPGEGNPIYPLTGAKTQEVTLLPNLGGEPLTVTFDSTPRLSTAPPERSFSERPAPSFGELWHSSVHRRLAWQTAYLQASRGSGRWISFTADLATERKPTSALENDRLFAYWGEYRYVDAQPMAIEVYDGTRKLVRRALARGGWLEYRYSTAVAAGAPALDLLVSVKDHLGREAKFAYDLPPSPLTEPRVVALTDPAGRQMKFSYDSNGHLFNITWPDGVSRQFVYEKPALPWALTGMVDERGVRESFYDYDALGRATMTRAANGANRFSVEWGSAPVSVADDTFDPVADVIWRDHYVTAPQGTNSTQPNGSVSAWTAVSVQGASLLGGRSQPAGSGCAASTSNATFDTNGNFSSKDDFNGARTCYVSSLSRNLETVRVAGLAGGASGTVCSSVTGAGAALPAGARKTSTEWHPHWRLQTRVAEPGRVTTYVYNGQPDPFAGGALASCAAGATALPDGKPIAVLCRQVEQATADADGALGFAAPLQAAVPAREQRWTYNAFGQVLTHDGPRTDVADITVHEYYADTGFTGTDPNAAGHTLGDLKQTTSPAGHVTRYPLYNKMGQVLQVLDPNGVATNITYDARQRPTSTTTAGQTTAYEYWPTGLLKRTTRADLSWVQQDYDEAQRLVRVSDNLGNSISYTLDNQGNRIAEDVRDPGNSLRRQLSRSIDALGRVQQVTGRE